jgi:ABC-type phosphate/phosphonate transport system substrate-binding protein
MQKDSPIRDIEDLEQRQSAFLSLAVFAASVLPRAILTK